VAGIEHIGGALEVGLNLFEGEAGDGLRLCLHLPLARVAKALHQRHQQQSQQDGGDGNHHQQLHQRKAPIPL
jgi:hypothetical protein